MRPVAQFAQCDIVNSSGKHNISLASAVGGRDIGAHDDIAREVTLGSTRHAACTKDPVGADAKSIDAGRESAAFRHLRLTSPSTRTRAYRGAKEKIETRMSNGRVAAEMSSVKGSESPDAAVRVALVVPGACMATAGRNRERTRQPGLTSRFSSEPRTEQRVSVSHDRVLLVRSASQVREACAYIAVSGSLDRTMEPPTPTPPPAAADPPSADSSVHTRGKPKKRVWLTESYELQSKTIWPGRGQHLLGQFDEDTMVVYQAYKGSIAEYAVANKKFEGCPGYKCELHRPRSSEGLVHFF